MSRVANFNEDNFNENNLTDKTEDKEIKDIGLESPKDPKEGETKNILIRLSESNALLYIFIIAFVLFIITRSIIFAIITGFSFIGYYIVDILVGIKQRGVIQEIKSIVIAVVIALIVWFGLIFILNTSSPISAIYSCSLLPRFERGDMIILQGVKASDIKAPEVELTPEEFSTIWGKVHVPCNTTGVITYVCSQCVRISSSTKKPIGFSQCAREILVNSSKGISIIDENFSNDVIVYSATYVNGRPYGGDIIHRAFAKIIVRDENGTHYFLLTKGDNNDLFDASVFNIVREQDIKGRVLLRIPWIGYLKLFISGSYIDPEGCEKIYEHNIR